MSKMQLKLTVADDLLTPGYAHDGDAGLDLKANIKTPMRLQRGSRVTVSTGVSVEIPQGFFGMVCPRSGLAKNFGLTVANAPGIIDSNFRGEIGVILQMHGDDPITINPFDRIAQLIIAPCICAELVIARALSETERGEGGFGSTGTGSEPCTAQ